MDNFIKSLPFDYASYQIDTSQLKQAIETLERGRVLLWSEMRGLRTSLDQIRSIDPHLLEYGPADRYMPDSAPDVLYLETTLHRARIQDKTALPDLIPQLPV
jgi:hypothetical protein